MSKTSDIVVRRPYIPAKKDEEVLEVAFDEETGKAVHIKDAFNGASHNYYVNAPDGKKYKVLAYQGTKLCWHYKLDKKVSAKKTREITEFNKHNIVAKLIQELGCLRIEPLKIFDDRCLTTDFDGLDRALYKNCRLYDECTIVTDTPAVYDSTMKYTSEGYRPDVMFTMNGEEYAIEVIDTYPLYPEINDEQALKKMQFYHERKVNVIVVRVHDLSMEQILRGEFKGQWYRSNYAEFVFENIYNMCMHSFLKENGLNVNNIDKATEVANCWKVRDDSKSICIGLCKECMASKLGLYAFRDRDRIDGDNKTYFFPYRTGHCIHCFKTNTYKLMRTTEYITLAGYLSRFNRSFGLRPDYFNEMFEKR